MVLTLIPTFDAIERKDASLKTLLKNSFFASSKIAFFMLFF